MIISVLSRRFRIRFNCDALQPYHALHQDHVSRRFRIRFDRDALQPDHTLHHDHVEVYTSVGIYVTIITVILKCLKKI